MGRNWHQLDDLRTNWILLRLGSPQSPSSSIGSFWEVAVGNATNLVETTAGDLASHESDTELLKALFTTLNQYRNPVTDTQTLLITPDQETLQQLRRWIMDRSKELAIAQSLRGFNHVAINQQLRHQFDYDLDSVGYQKQPQVTPQQPETQHGEVTTSAYLTDLWELWIRIFTLLPPTAMQGTPL